MTDDRILLLETWPVNRRAAARTEPSNKVLCTVREDMLIASTAGAGTAVA